ncbi:MAG TPA: winged helix-turn-helix domain-containing protein [Anaerolineae bacterium]|nr:winged helix-turn-helix domain-containing protein [Anaerolineae bacterium]
MKLFRLGSRAYRTLQKIVQSGSNGRQVRRAQALLWLHENETVQAVAHRLRLSRQAIYGIVQRYHARSHLPVAERVQDQPHPGRPATIRQRTQQVIHELLQRPPSRLGYRSPIWTAPRLRRQVEKRLRRRISIDTVRRALHQLRHRYKRPRLVLAQRSPYWRQSKGG